MKNLFKFKMVMLAMMLLLSVPVFSQTLSALDNPNVSAITANLSTFMGIVAFVSLVVTQLAKLIPVIDINKVLKILTSVLVGILASFASWWFGLAEFLSGLIWWQVLIQGIFSGLVACGAYDLLRSLLSKQ